MFRIAGPPASIHSSLQTPHPAQFAAPQRPDAPPRRFMTQQTYPAYPDRCGWNALLPERQPRPPARGRVRVKHAIVGAGFTGVAAARRLSELDPNGDTVVLEATTVGDGSSGRNSGFLSQADIAGGIDATAVEKNLARNHHVGEAFDDLVRLIEAHRIDCELNPCGRIKAAATVGGEAAVRDLQKVCDALAVPYQILDGEQLRARTGTAYYRLGIFTDVGHLVQPAALIRGLVDALPERVQRHERSPVVALRKQGHGRGTKWLLETPEATITADTVIMAANSSVKAFGYLRDRLVTIYTYAAITEALAPADQGQIGAMPTWGLLPAHRLGTTLRRVGPDRLLVRSLYAYERGVPAKDAQAALLARFHRRYPGLAHVGLEFVWGGTTALTLNGAPYWGRIDDGLFASAGCNGSGIVKGTALGKRLAGFALGQAVDRDLLAAYGTANRIAPEPLRRVGFKVISAWEGRKAGLES